jgi:hypothetical protein
MRIIIERFLSDDPADLRSVPIGAVSVERESEALREAMACGIVEPSDRYRTATPRESLVRAIHDAVRPPESALRTWNAGELAVCSLLARTVRIVRDTGDGMVTIDGGSTGLADVARGTLYSTITKKVGESA